MFHQWQIMFARSFGCCVCVCVSEWWHIRTWFNTSADICCGRRYRRVIVWTNCWRLYHLNEWNGLLSFSICFVFFFLVLLPRPIPSHRLQIFLFYLILTYIPSLVYNFSLSAIVVSDYMITYFISLRHRKKNPYVS